MKGLGEVKCGRGEREVNWSGKKAIWWGDGHVYGKRRHACGEFQCSSVGRRE
jgi:hypothetical protein